MGIQIFGNVAAWNSGIENPISRGCLSPPCPRGPVPRDSGLLGFEMEPRLCLPISRPGSGGWSPWQPQRAGTTVAAVL